MFKLASLLILIAAHANALDLAGLLATVRSPSNSKFTTSDNRGADLDGLQITQVSASEFLGAYHHYIGPSSDDFEVDIASAPSVFGPWTYRVSIDRSKASQPELKLLPDGRYLLAYEKKDGKISIQFKLFDDQAALFANNAMKSYLAPRPSGVKTIGTPNFRWVTYDGTASQKGTVSTMRVEIGLHENDGGQDFEGLGFMTGFTGFSSYKNTNLQNAVARYSKGNIGDRTFFVYNGKPYTVIEGQTSKGDFQTWRIYLWDETAMTLTPLNIKTDQGSVAFGNPSITLYTGPSGELLLFMSAFLFSPSASPAGCLSFSGDLRTIGSDASAVSSVSTASTTSLASTSTATPSVASTSASTSTSTTLTASTLTGTTATGVAVSSGSYSAGSLQLAEGQSVTTAAGLTFVMQKDGNLVLYSSGAAVWASNTMNRCIRCLASFQGDGNLVVYNRDNMKALFATATDNKGSQLSINSASPYVKIANASGSQVYPNVAAGITAARAVGRSTYVSPIIYRRVNTAIP